MACAGKRTCSWPCCPYWRNLKIFPKPAMESFACRPGDPASLRGPARKSSGHQPAAGARDTGRQRWRGLRRGSQIFQRSAPDCARPGSHSRSARTSAQFFQRTCDSRTCAQVAAQSCGDIQGAGLRGTTHLRRGYFRGVTPHPASQCARPLRGHHSKIG